ncbi:2-hydroxyacid dehydrogenase [Microbacterium terricola]|uniref:Dehydrogenase n=1 Tax=Microbacterium terricola TaxID=344163 RepID=A0ABM8DV45_9MICO|nr:2-hydroxyacid dehydrogenase [Microbacterium terricola]UYK39811.1 2-hydroxyacid dehydrogenase [Microbacterium terricola]BDV29437.1 dehydrogenase [Microbacterium terricola]
MSDSIRPLVISLPDERLSGDVGPLPDGVELLIWPMDGPAPRDEIDLVVPPYMSTAEVLPRLADVRTRLVQSQSIGYDGIERVLPPGVVFANAASVHETSTAELAVGLAIAAQRRLPDFVRAQGEERWAPAFAQSLADRRVLLLGYGGVGKAVAARLAAFEVELTAVARTARDEDGMRVHAVDELPALLPRAEIVIVTLPGTAATRHIVDDAFLAALPDGALVINVGRGPLIDTDALVDHVRRGRLRAALDVVDPEPLPAGHPLWSLPGVLISPHVGGATSAMRPRIARLVHRQIERMLAGEPPLNVVLES